jgi:hypothetical protein
MTISGKQHEPLFDVHPTTGVSIEVFFAGGSLAAVGSGGAGWFWWSRRRGFAPEGPATGPFATSYAAYRDACIRSFSTQGCNGVATTPLGENDLKARRFL